MSQKIIKMVALAAVVVAMLCTATMTTVSAQQSTQPAFKLNVHAPDAINAIDPGQAAIADQKGRLTYFEGRQDTFVILRSMLPYIAPPPGAKVVIID